MASAPGQTTIVPRRSGAVAHRMGTSFFSYADSVRFMSGNETVADVTFMRIQAEAAKSGTPGGTVALTEEDASDLGPLKHHLARRKAGPINRAPT